MKKLFFLIALIWMNTSLVAENYSIHFNSIPIQSFCACDTIPIPVKINSCGPYTAENGSSYSQSGVYLLTYPTPSGCDSLVSMDLTVTDLKPNIDQVGNILVCDIMADSYTWINCNTNQPIPGLHTRNVKLNLGDSITVKVLVIKNGCSAVSDCAPLFRPLSNTNFENRVSLNLNVFPNPNKGSFTLSWGQEIPEAQIQIYSAQGALVYEKQLKDGDHADLYLSLPKGIYFAIVNGADMRFSARVVID